MEIGVLGRLRVLRDRREVDLGPHKQRALLAALSLHAGGVVSVDRLADLLWGDNPPAGYDIKGNASSRQYHVPGGRYYDITIADVFFDTAEHAEAAGYEATAADTTDTEENN